MSTAEIHGAALHAALRGRRTVAPLIEREPALTVDDAYAISLDFLSRRLAEGERVVGKKIGVTSKTVQDMLGGQIECGFLAGPTVLPHVRAGRLNALAVSGAKRSPMLPEVPAVAEAGFPGYDATFSLVLFAPKGTPADIVSKMHEAMAAALRSPDMVDRLAQSEQTVAADSPADSAARLAQDSKRWGEVARRIKLRLV